MKWEDISKRLPGRSAISCRLHYQNYLERRSEWDEERKNKLARLYERFKPEMWSKVAEEMAIPWRAAEAMHWQLGETDMARRAGVVPFSLSAVSIDAPPQTHTPLMRHSPRHSHHHSHSMGTPRERYQRGQQPLLPSVSQTSRPLAARQESSTPRSLHASLPASYRSDEHTVLAGIPSLNGYTAVDTRGSGRGILLPSVAEMTTGVSMAGSSAPAYSVTTGIAGSGYVSAPVTRGDGWDYAGGGYTVGRGWTEGKRRPSPDDLGIRETTRRRH